MTYEEFKAQMQSDLKKSFEYGPNAVGFKVMAENMAELADRFPKYDEMLENGI